MEIFVVLISWLIFGGASSYFAIQRGRDPFAWFLIGIFLGIFGVLLLFLLPPLSEEVSSENSPEKDEEKQDTSYRLKSWYYLDDARQQVGPATFNQLKVAERQGKIHSDTLFWCEGMLEWKTMDELPEIKENL